MIGPTSCREPIDRVREVRDEVRHRARPPPLDARAGGNACYVRTGTAGGPQNQGERRGPGSSSRRDLEPSVSEDRAPPPHSSGPLIPISSIIRYSLFR
jgi:hypothetical protein